MGKTTFIETQLRPYFDSTDIKFSSISSDQIRKEFIDEATHKSRANGQRKTKDQIFQETTRASVAAF